MIYKAFSMRMFVFMLLCVTGLSVRAQMPGQKIPEQPPITVHETAQGLEAAIGDEALHVIVCRDNVIHVVAGPAPLRENTPQPWMLDSRQSCPGGKFQFAKDAEKATLTTAALKVEFSLERGSLQYKTVTGDGLLSERNSVPRTYEKAEINGEATHHVTERFSLDMLEGIYGLGQHQSGMFNYRGSTVELGQNNTDVAVPFFVSSKGYGLLWNTASFGYVDNRFPIELNLTALAGDTVDYYFIYGPEFDQLIHAYRNLTGHAPMLPKWAYGFFQSKDRYVSLDEIIDIASRYRKERIPLDAMVQDWFWWKTEGDPVFNKNYSDVPAQLKSLHDEHVHAMLSVWGLFDPAAENFKTLAAHKFDVPNAHVYDATNPAARDFYWNNLAGKLFSQGWDAFWLDSAEPEEHWPHMGDAILRDKQLAIGNGARYTNVFPLMHNEGVQQHWRNTTDQKRVFLLTRSAFLGQQRVGATVWSGDVYGTYWALSHQVPAGLNYALSGLPYWTTDIGGYWPPTDQPLDGAAYQQLYARWFQFGAFCPVFRTHGHRPHNEFWTYDKVEPILIQYDKLRYRLMPYIYSLAWRVHNDDYTIQRPLVMDWRNDLKTRNVGDEFMFGPALLVSPVLKQDATRRTVYLPESKQWYDFWSGESFNGNQEIEADAPLDKLPLFVRAGSIIPLGPEIMYADEKPDGPVELRIYPGADGKFDLYSDAGDGYDYEKGKYSIIPIRWSEADRTLTIGGRTGEYPGMSREITFHVVRASSGHGTGERVETHPDKEVTYSGKLISIHLPE